MSKKNVKRQAVPPKSLKGQKEVMTDEEMERALLRNQLQEEVGRLGGLKIYHAHLDRSLTNIQRFQNMEANGAGYAALATLAMKQSGIGELHRDTNFLATYWQRMEYVVHQMACMGVAHLDSFIDTTADEVKLIALKTAQALQEAYKEHMTFRFGCYNVFGFKKDSPERWDFFCQAAKQADFIGGLPERDDLGNLPDHIGFYDHLYRILSLGQELDKEVHIHLDQMNLPQEHGTWILCEHLRHNIPVRNWNSSSDENQPKIWAVHAISPSCYTEEHWKEFLNVLQEARIGIIVCPKAAIGMRQHRSVVTPTHNCIARVLEMAAEGVPVRFGIDNIGDSLMPEGSWDFLEEVVFGASILRYYNPTVLAKFCTGTKLTETDREDLRAVIEANRQNQKALENMNYERFR